MKIKKLGKIKCCNLDNKKTAREVLEVLRRGMKVGNLRLIIESEEFENWLGKESRIRPIFIKDSAWVDILTKQEPKYKYPLYYYLFRGNLRFSYAFGDNFDYWF